MTRLQDQHQIGIVHTTVNQLRVVSDSLGDAFDAIFDARMKLNTFFIDNPVQWNNVNWREKTYTVDDRVYSFKDW